MASGNIFYTSRTHKLFFLKDLYKATLLLWITELLHGNFSEIISLMEKIYIFSIFKKSHNVLFYLFICVSIWHKLKSKSLVLCLQCLSDCTYNICKMLFPNYWLWSAHPRVIRINLASLPEVWILESLQKATCFSSSEHHSLIGSLELQIEILLSVTGVDFWFIFF